MAHYFYALLFLVSIFQLISTLPQSVYHHQVNYPNSNIASQERRPVAPNTLTFSAPGSFSNYGKQRF